MNLGISDEHRQGSIEKLQLHLADFSVLYTKAKFHHWNVEGIHFYALHALFDELAGQLLPATDDIAERIRALGGYANGTLATFLRTTTLTEEETHQQPTNFRLQRLLADYEHVIRQLRADVDTTANTYADAGTSDFLTGLMEDLEKSAWKIRAHLQ
jgi:starvation-inducible DNA-binding protein